MQTVAAADAAQNDDVNRPQAPVHYSTDVPFFNASHTLAEQNISVARVVLKNSPDLSSRELLQK